MSERGIMVRIDKILCPVDFFPASEQALKYAIQLAQNYEARLTLLHVVSPTLHPGFELPLDMSQMIKAMSEDARQRLTQLAKTATRVKVPVQCIVKTGDVEDVINRTVKSERAGLVVMGTHGRRGVERWFMGSVTERLLRGTLVPLLTIGTTKQKPQITPPAIRRILVTTDFSAGTPDAMAYAFSIAQECQAEITLLHVINDTTPHVGGTYRESMLSGVREQLEKMIPDEARNWCEVKTRVETGLPLRIILKIIASDNIDLLVMNIHGKGMLDRALVGSTAERVVRGATCPVLMIPPRPGAKRKRQASKKTF